MVARSQLAVLDYNDGSAVGQAITKRGELRYKQSFSKVIQSWCVKKIINPKKRNYLKDLINTAMVIKRSPEGGNMPVSEEIPQNIAPIERPDKKEAIQTMRSRFKI